MLLKHGYAPAVGWEADGTVKWKSRVKITQYRVKQFCNEGKERKVRVAETFSDNLKFLSIEI